MGKLKVLPQALTGSDLRWGKEGGAIRAALAPEQAQWTFGQIIADLLYIPIIRNTNSTLTILFVLLGKLVILSQHPA